MKYLTRVVTFMAHPRLLSNNPQEILEQGSRVVTHSEPTRVFTVRKVAYDDSMTPLYCNPTYGEETRFNSVESLLESHPGLADKPILDKDKSLKIFDNE